MTIQFESHRVELAAIYEMEHDAHVREYFDQPPSIKLLYDSANNRGMGVLHTPDFFVIRDDAVGWEEWKTEEELNRLAEHNQNRYQRDETGLWRCPPGEAYASQSGLYYRVRSAQGIDWVFQRNMQFLDDYLRADCPPCVPAVYERLLGHILATRGLSLEMLFDTTQDVATRDEIYLLIATGALSVDIRSASLREPARVLVFAPGDEQPQRIAGGRTDDSPHAPQTTRQAMDPEILKMLSNAGEQDLRMANLRCRVVRERLQNGPRDADPSVPARTLRRWAASYRSAEQRHGNGYVGLLPRSHDRGNATQRLPENTRLLMNEFIAGDY
ncbi:MAG: Tn7 transposase TnsA N-terminal domain-containing protein, partial [Terracidiphilus sp.]